MSERNRKVACRNCEWHGMNSDILVAKNPFDDNDEIAGCPECKTIDSLKMICDEPGCWNEATCGTPIKGGYRHTCGKHRPEF